MQDTREDKQTGSAQHCTFFNLSRYRYSRRPVKVFGAAERQHNRVPAPLQRCKQLSSQNRVAGCAPSQATQLEALAARLAARSTRLLHGAAAYRQGLCAMSEGFATLAERLHEFCGGADDTSEEFMSVGAPWQPLPHTAVLRGGRCRNRVSTLAPRACCEQFLQSRACSCCREVTD